MFAARMTAATADSARRHLLAEPRTIERMDMALRLLRWMGAPTKAATSFASAVREYVREGGFVDWAPQVLRGGETVPELAQAHAELIARVTEAREEQNWVFASLLRDALAAGSLPEDVPGVEQVLDRVVAPLAAAAPVLLLVFDGMSQAVFREILDELTRTGWLELRPETTALTAALAVLPSVTEASRTSLLCGELRTGQAAHEKAGFARHAGLRAAGKKPPILHHKASLHDQGDPSLSPDVRQAIAESTRRVVGVVINAIDDHLARGEQTDPRWGQGYIKVLPALLHEARSAGRLLILVSDHGHVLDQGTRTYPGDNGGARWRPDDGTLAAEEVRLAGPRVLLGGGRIIVPWSERVRYGGPSNGYHGGATPQEVVVPLAVLSPGGSLPAGWQEAPAWLPDWWEAPPPHRPGASGIWIDALLESETYRAQRSLAGRNPPSDDLVRGVLSALDAFDGKISETALASRLGLPPSQLASALAAVQRLLNADGYPILSRDTSAGTVELNRELLARQFVV
jgi:hypothetical protein